MQAKRRINLRRSRRRGFTLTELAIVLGVMSAVIGGIWYAASAAYSNFRSRYLLKELTLIQGNLHFLVSSTVATAADQSQTDNCGQMPPCATELLRAAAVFESDFVVPGIYGDGSAFGVGQLYITKYGYLIWSGIENGEIYAAQAGSCPPSGCPAAPTVLEVDLFGMSLPVCAAVLMSVINSHMNGLYSITTTTNGWGPMTTSYGGTPNMPTSMSLSTATQACVPGAGAYGYDTSTQSQIWLWFQPN